MAFVDWANGVIGRGARIVLGLALAGTGVALGGGWLALVLVGVVAIVAGVSATCLVAPLLHRPLRGGGIRG